MRNCVLLILVVHVVQRVLGKGNKNLFSEKQIDHNIPPKPFTLILPPMKSGLSLQDLLFWASMAWMGIAAATFIVLRFVSAPYGRHTRPGWGPTLPNHIGWVIMELPSLVLMPLLFWLGPVVKTEMHWIVLGLYWLHYVNRALIFPFRLRTRGKRMPVAIMGSAIFFNLVNTTLMGTWLGWLAEWPLDWHLSPQFIAGLALFILGAGINIDSDNRLLRLRRGTETGYKIPHGGLFAWVSCPNLLGELLEWCGYALLCWHWAPLTFAVWTIANLLPRALDHHAWYLKTFPDYPKERKAVFPFLL